MSDQQPRFSDFTGVDRDTVREARRLFAAGRANDPVPPVPEAPDTPMQPAKLVWPEGPAPVL